MNLSYTPFVVLSTIFLQVTKTYASKLKLQGKGSCLQLARIELALPT